MGGSPAPRAAVFLLGSSLGEPLLALQEHGFEVAHIFCTASDLLSLTVLRHHWPGTVTLGPSSKWSSDEIGAALRLCASRTSPHENTKLVRPEKKQLSLLL